MKSHRFIDSPVGRLMLVVERGVLTAVYHDVHEPPPVPAAVGVPFATLAEARTADAATFDRAAEQFRAYFAGKRRAFSLPVQASGTAFQEKVWTAVLDIPYGETRSYKDLAAQLGNESMGRAIGAAIRINPLAIIIPGHRVVRSTGGITGYSAGPEVKRFLLDLEANDVILPAA